MIHATSPYLNDILSQPAALQATLEALAPNPAFLRIAAQLAAGNFRQVVLTGMGSSYYALHPFHLRLLEAGCSSLMIETSELVHYAQALVRPHSLIVAVSQSGESAEIHHLLELARDRSSLIGITNTPGSALAGQADAAILTAAGPEFSVSCKTYTAALVGLAWLGDLLLQGRAQAEMPHLAAAPELVAMYLERWQDHVSVLVERLRGIHSHFLLGRGPSLAAAGAGALIIKEAARAHSEGMSCAAFRHGPLEIVSENIFTLVYQGAAPTAAANARLAKDIRASGGQVELARPGNAGSPFDLPAGGQETLAILEILPAQMVSIALAELKGIEPGRFLFASKVTTVE